MLDGLITVLLLAKRSLDMDGLLAIAIDPCYISKKTAHIGNKGFAKCIPCYFTAIFTLSLPILATTMVPCLAENETLPSIDFAVPRAFPSRA